MKTSAPRYSQAATPRSCSGCAKLNGSCLFTGNTVERTITTALRVETALEGSYRMRSFHSLRGAWVDDGLVTADRLRTGIAVELERKGFAVLELEQET